MKLSSHTALSVVKLLLIGDPGAGKTGALASLAKAGYNLRIIDLDNGLDILLNLLADDPAALDRVDFVTATDSFKNINGRIIPKKPEAWPKVSSSLHSFPDCGSPLEWTPKEVLVIDSMTLAGLAALRWVMAANGRAGVAPYQSDFLEAQNALETMCQFLFDASVNCNVIVTSHVTLVGEKGFERGYATTIGKALSPKIGRYFNSILYAKSTTRGTTTIREIVTQPVTNLELKNSSPNKVMRSYPLATGLASFFEDVKAH
jgi:hypothetical protein